MLLKSMFKFKQTMVYRCCFILIKIFNKSPLINIDLNACISLNNFVNNNKSMS